MNIHRETGLARNTIYSIKRQLEWKKRKLKKYSVCISAGTGFDQYCESAFVVSVISGTATKKFPM